MRMDRLDADARDIIDRRREAQRLDVRRGSRLEAGGGGGVGGALERHPVDHRPAALPRRQRVELVAPQYADAGRPIKLVPRKHIIVAAQRRDVRSEEHTYELQSLMRTPYAVF